MKNQKGKLVNVKDKAKTEKLENTEDEETEYEETEDEETEYEETEDENESNEETDEEYVESEEFPAKFIEVNRNIFNGFKFNFENITPKYQKYFSCIIKVLGGEIAYDNESYTLSVHSHMTKEENLNRTDIFNLAYIFDSIKAHTALNIDQYRQGKYMMLLSSNIKKGNTNNSSKCDVQNTETESSFIQNQPTSSNGWMNIKKNQNNNSSIPKSGKKSIKDSSSSSDISFNDDDSAQSESVLKNRTSWLDTKNIKDIECCKIATCTWEPGRHRKHNNEMKMMQVDEIHVLLKYFITTNSIHLCKGIKMYELMHEDGYLVHRSTETLRNAMRRTVKKNLKTYNIPKKYLDEFKRILGS